MSDDAIDVQPDVAPDDAAQPAAVDASPSVEPPVVCSCGAPRHAEKADRCAKGHTLPGNETAKKHGAWSYQRGRGEAAVPADTRSSIQDFVQQVTADRGGPETLTALERGYIQRLGELETVARLIANHLATHKIFTPKGRVRSALSKWLEVVNTWDRYAQRIGTDRKARQLPKSIGEWLDSPPEPEGGNSDEYQ